MGSHPTETFRNNENSSSYMNLPDKLTMFSTRLCLKMHNKLEKNKIV